MVQDEPRCVVSARKIIRSCNFENSAGGAIDIQLFVWNLERRLSHGGRHDGYP